MSLEKGARSLEDVKVWFRCSVCSGYLSSIPALKDHSNYEHNLAPQDVKLPENLPPGAKEGKVFFEYLPYDRGDEGEDSDDTLPLYNIRIRDVADLVEISDEEQEEERNRQNERSKASDDSGDDGPNNRITSPPDSGMFEDDDDRVNEIPEDDEGQQHQTIIPPSRSRNKDPQSLTSSSSAGKENNKQKFPCPVCQKSYRSQGTLNFHARKAHPQNQSTATKDNNSSKLILKFTRDAGTGTFTAATGLPRNGSPVRAALRSNRGPARLTGRAPPSTSTESPQDEIVEPSASSTVLNSEKESDSDGSPLRRRRPNRTLPLVPSSSSEKSEAEMDSDDEETSTSTKRVLRKRKKLPRRTVVEFVSDSEISFITSSSVSKKSRRTDGTTEEDSDEEAEMTDKNTTSEDELRAPSLSDHSPVKSPSPTLHGGDDDVHDDNDGEGGKKMNEKAKAKSPENSSTDYDDLFVPIAPKIKKKKKKRSKTKSSTAASFSSMGPPAPPPPAPVPVLRQSSTICKQCNIECKDSNALIRHMKSLHKGSTLVCGFCKKRYSKKHHFNRHIMTHQKEYEKDKESAGDKMDRI